MAQHDRIKKRIFRGVVDENLEAIERKPRGTRRRERARRVTLIRRGMLAAASVLLLALVATAWFEVAARTEAASVRTRPGFEPAGMAGTAAQAPHEGIVSMQRITELLADHEPQQMLAGVVPLAVRRVAVDAGHGGRDGGTALSYGLCEKDLTLDIATRLGELLSNAGCEVVQTRTEDVEVSLKQRALIANQARADIFLSIHVNWLPRREARGVETYLLGTTDDPFLRRLAAAENRDSGFSVADYRRLLEGIYADVRQAESRRLAEGVQNALFETLKQENMEIEDRGVMTAPFVVLIATEMPAILAEVACLSNDREARLLAIPRYRQKIAEALYGGISGYARSVSRSVLDSGQPVQTEKGP